MQARKTQKNKYVQPQVFSIPGATRSANSTHCRSLVDLNSINNSAQKENLNYEHYTTLLSSKPDKNLLEIRSGSNGTSGVRQPLSNQKSISNITKILMGNSKNKQDFNTSKNNSFVQISATTMLKPKNQANEQRKNDPLSSIPKNEARTSSQTNLREIGGQAKNATHRNKGQSSLERDQSNKSFNKVRKNEERIQNKDTSEHNLMIKLKESIEELKENEKNNLAEIERLKSESSELRQEKTLLIDKIQVYQIREKEMMKKMKTLEANRNSSKMAQNKTIECQEHQLIIQSLKNVINEQMTKIIEFERYKIQIQEVEKLRNLQHKKEGNWNESWDKEESENESDEEKDYGHEKQREIEQGNKAHEVYSFKKRNKLNESSICTSEEEQVNSCSTSKLEGEESWSSPKKYSGMNKKAYFSNIPEPNNGLDKCLESDSRLPEKRKTPTSSEMMSKDSSKRSSFINEREKNHENQNDEHEEEFEKFEGRCSGDEILQEVGQYLSYFKRNVGES